MAGVGRKEHDVVYHLVVKPRAQRDEVVTWESGSMHIRVKSPAREGQANDACRRLLARVFGISVSQVVLLKGTSSRVKKVVLRGVSARCNEDAMKRWLSEQRSM